MPISRQAIRPPFSGPAGIWLLRLLTVIPLGLAFVTAVRAPRLHVLLGYWHVLAKITNDDGDLIVGQVFTYHPDQPFVVPSLLFWADAAWFGGDNRVLTVLTVVLMAAVVAILRLMLPTSLSPVKKAALTAGFAFVLLSSHAAELWLQATNGISWVPAVFFSVLAISLAHHGRFWWACAAGVIGCLCFGAAFPVWFALTVIRWLRRDAVPKVVVPGAVGVLVFGLWFATKPPGQQSLATSAFDPDGRLSVVAAAIGGLWSADLAVVAVIAGGAIALLSLLSWNPIRQRVTEPGAALNDSGRGRTRPHHRRRPRRQRRPDQPLRPCHRPRNVRTPGARRAAPPSLAARYLVAVALTIGLVTHGIGVAKADAAKRNYAPLQIATVALRVDAPTALTALRIQPAAVAAARALHDHPFTNDFTLGCGEHELGSHIDLTTVEPLPGPDTTTPNKGVIDTTPVTGDALLSGWANLAGSKADCVLVIDASGNIVGGGVTGLPRPDLSASGSNTAWQAAAMPGANDPTVVISSAGPLHRITATPHH